MSDGADKIRAKPEKKAILNCHTIIRNFRRRHRGSAYVSGLAKEIREIPRASEKEIQGKPRTPEISKKHPRFSLSRQSHCLSYKLIMLSS
ncbi:MAG: hypothetical protein LBC86_01700 [Oscillospiraceae bacterium]|nr:hypothetical protein [Oscillospiraceae bacterium]